MTAVIYICEKTGLHVHGWFDGDGDKRDDTYHSMTCLACGQVHLVNTNTGRVLGAVDQKLNYFPQSR